MANLLCLDIGSGTQDVLYYMGEPGVDEDHCPNLENCPKFVLPSPARRVGEIMAGHTRQGRAIHLFGCNMGGGFGRAVKAHNDAGLGLSMTRDAALALSDDLDRVRSWGIELNTACPPGFHPVELADYSPGFWRAFLDVAGLPYPDGVLVAAQDHGFHPGSSNRLGRFAIWEDLLTSGRGRLEALAFRTPPETLTRLQAIQATSGSFLLMDTGAAAVLGALFVPGIARQARERGVTILNLGNSHSVAFLVYGETIHGVYEQHTGFMDRDSILRDMEAFRKGRLTMEEVFDRGGHGCLTRQLPAGADFAPLYVLGPQRALLRGVDCEFPAPGGDMMLAGCYGLVKGCHLAQNRV